MKKAIHGYLFTFADGHQVWAMNMNRQEIKVWERDHGKLISKKAA